MASKNRVGGLIELKVNGVIYSAKGNFSYNLGHIKRTAVVGADRPHGFSGLPQVPFIEGEITDNIGLDLEAVLDFDEETCTLLLATGKTIALKEGWYAGDGTGQTEEGNIGFRMEGMSAEVVTP